MDITKLKLLFELLSRLFRGRKIPFRAYVEEFGKGSLLMRTFVISGIVFPILCLLLWACSVNKDFFIQIEKLNENTLEEWSDDILRLPGYQKSDKENQFQLFEDMLGPALDERKLIIQFGNLTSDKTEEEYVKSLKEKAEIRYREEQKYLEALIKEAETNAGK